MGRSPPRARARRTRRTPSGRLSPSGGGGEPRAIVFPGVSSARDRRRDASRRRRRRQTRHRRVATGGHESLRGRARERVRVCPAETPVVALAPAAAAGSRDARAVPPGTTERLGVRGFRGGGGGGDGRRRARLCLGGGMLSARASRLRFDGANSRLDRRNRRRATKTTAREGSTRSRKGTTSNARSNCRTNCRTKMRRVSTYDRTRPG